MSDLQPADVPVILMWGGTATGKSSLAAAALFDPDPEYELPSLDRGRTGSSANAAGLSRIWQGLREGRPAVPTVKDEVSITLFRDRSTPVLLKDVRGGLVDFVSDEPTERLVRSAAVILFIMDFHSRDAIRQLRAIDPVWNLCAGIPKGLVFTKCELHLDRDHDAWEKKRNWWQDFQQLRALGSHIERFGDAVFPTSVYGYNPESKFPAFTLGEFGELRPLSIRPRGVTRPLAWALSQIDAHDPT
jgi:hypothetical protein